MEVWKKCVSLLFSCILFSVSQFNLLREWTPFHFWLHHLDPFGNQCRCDTNFSVAFYRGDFLVAFDRNSSQISLHITEYIRSRGADDIGSLSSSHLWKIFHWMVTMIVDSPRLKSYCLVSAENIQELSYWSGLYHMFFLEPITVFRDIGEAGCSWVMCPPLGHVFTSAWRRDVMVSAPPNLK